MSEIRKQEIIVFAGPNGSGKSDICNVYDNSNSTVKRIFKKRKEKYFYNETKYWNKESIINLTGINNIEQKNLNNF